MAHLKTGTDNSSSLYRAYHPTFQFLTALKRTENMSAYVIGHITVKDDGKWAEYRQRVPGTLEPWGAELVFRGRRTKVLAGEHCHTDTVVIRFPDQRALQAWYDSTDYQALIPLRSEAAEIVLVAYDG
jgi:uncharacterized protein (DUF1330 family)